MELGLDAGTAAIIVALSGMFLWFVTQVHLLRVARAIRSDIDGKRAATEIFVSAELDKLAKDIGGFEARIHAEMPPNVDGRIAALDEELKVILGNVEENVLQRVDAIDRGLKAAMDTLDSRLDQLPARARQSMLGVEGNQVHALNRSISLAGEELEGMVAAAVPDIADSRNALERELYGWLRKPIDPKLEETNPSAALLQRLAKVGASEFLGRGRSTGGMTYPLEGGYQAVR
jgi:hypothetical protein